jgi:hypothetical protein
MSIPDFRYWIAANDIDVVSLLMGMDNKAYIFSLKVPEATKDYPDDSVEVAIYKLSKRTLFKQNES